MSYLILVVVGFLCGYRCFRWGWSVGKDFGRANTMLEANSATDAIQFVRGIGDTVAFEVWIDPHDGAVMLDYDAGFRQAMSMSFNGDGCADFAYALGKTREHGRLRIADAIALLRPVVAEMSERELSQFYGAQLDANDTQPKASVETSPTSCSPDKNEAGA